MFSSGSVRADDFIQKGSPVVPIGLKVPLTDLPPGSYRLLTQAVDSEGHKTASRGILFDVIN